MRYVKVNHHVSKENIVKISSYISSLRETFTKTDLVEDCRLIKATLAEVRASYKASLDTIGKTNFKSKTAKDYDATYRKNVKGVRGNTNIIAGVYNSLNLLTDKLTVIENNVNTSNKADYVREAINAMDLNIVRFLELSRFTVEYSNSLLLALLRCESNVLNERDELEDFTKAEVMYIANNSANYWEALSKFTKSAKELDHTFKSIPDLVLNEDNADSMVSIAGSNKIDPLEMGFMPVSWNPFYHIGMAVAEYQASKFDKIVEQRKMIEFKLLQLQKARQGNTDALLERKIEVTQQRLDKINFELNKRIEEYGLDGSQYG